MKSAQGTPFKRTSGRRSSSLRTSLITVFLFCFSAAPTYLLAKEQGLDVAIIMDTSSSMNKNDPGRLRLEAAKLFVALLGRKDRVALISFSGKAYPITRFLSLNERKNEQKLLRSIDKLVANGKYTNLHDALLRGYELLSRKNSNNNAKHIILLSDGEMDLGNQKRNLRLLEKTLEELIPKLANEGIKVHTVAFTKQSYVPLLKLAAQDTQGQFMILDSPTGIHHVVENLFERTKNPEMVHLTEDSFVLDNAVNELTIVATKFKPYSNISLENPDGEEISKDHHNKSINWFAAKQFDLITIKNPTKGYWLVKYSEGGNKVYIVSDFKLIASTTKRHAEPGSPLQIQAYLSKNGKKINQKRILKTTEFKAKVTSPTGAIIENLLIDDGSEIGSERNDGIYGISYAFDFEGTYKIEITATGQTFDRKKNLFVDVLSTNPALPFVQAQAKAKKLAEQKKQQKLAESLRQQEAELLAETEQLEAGKITSENISFETDHNNEPIHKPDESEEHSNILKENGIDEETTPNGTFQLGEALFAFIMFNILLGSLGGGYYYFFRRKKTSPSSKNSKDNIAADTDNTNQTPKDSVDLTADSTSEEFGRMSDDSQEIEESISSVLSDIDLDEDLETELTSILESEMNKIK